MMAASAAINPTDLEDLITQVARRFVRPGVPIEDLEQIGRIGLLKAVSNFDPTRGEGLGSNRRQELDRQCISVQGAA